MKTSYDIEFRHEGTWKPYGKGCTLTQAIARLRKIRKLGFKARAFKVTTEITTL